MGWGWGGRDGGGGVGSPDRCDGDHAGMKGRCPPMLGPPQPFTMRPASTVGTRVSLLPSPTPNSCSFPELSRLVGWGGEGEEGRG